MSNVDTLRRQFVIIEFMKNYCRHLKRAVSTTQVYEHLHDLNFDVSKRMVQRDLVLIQKALPNIKRRGGNPAGWYFERAVDDDEDDVA